MLTKIDLTGDLPSVAVQSQLQAMNSQLSLEEVAKHNSNTDCWIIIDDYVFNVTGYLQTHPGGRDVILAYAGSDATDAFNEVPGHVEAIRLLDDMCIGKLQSGS